MPRHGICNGGTEAINLIMEKVRRLAQEFRDFDHWMIFTVICDMHSVLHRQQLPSLSRLEMSRESGRRGSIFGRRSGISLQPSLTAATINACSALRTPVRMPAGQDRAFH